MVKNRRLICITGPDGSGKSTLINSLHTFSPDKSRISHIWELLETADTALPFRNKKDIDSFLCGLTPDSRLLFLAHAMKYSIDSALDSPAEIILINGYFYKYFASELTLGASEHLVADLIYSFPKPDLIIYLDLEPLDASLRKEAYSRYECGLEKIPGSDSFIYFQEKVMTYWNMYDRADWHILNSKDAKKVLHHEAKGILGWK